MTPVFWIAGIVAVLGAVGVVAARTPVHSVLALVINFVALAALYLSLDAEFLAVIQIIIYAGAILILFLFVIALLSASKSASEHSTSRLVAQKELGIAAAVVAGLLLTVSIFRNSSGFAGARVQDGFGSAASFGKELLTTHVFAFELTAFVLMVAVVGVVVLVGRRHS